MSRRGEILVLCYGNPARLDDGLGPVFGSLLEEQKVEGFTVETNYQLTVEDSTLLADHELVLFVDASMAATEPFSLTRIHPGAEATFSTHSVQPENLLTLTEKVFKKRIPGYAIGIRGYTFDSFGEVLTSRARDNLNATLNFLLAETEQVTLSSLQARLEEEVSRQCELRRLKCKTASM